MQLDSARAVWHVDDAAVPLLSMPPLLLLFVIVVVMFAGRGDKGFTECTESSKFPPIFAAELKAPPAAAAAPPRSQDGTACVGARTLFFRLKDDCDSEPAAEPAAESSSATADQEGQNEDEDASLSPSNNSPMS